jgi:hypothetical protein
MYPLKHAPSPHKCITLLISSLSILRITALGMRTFTIITTKDCNWGIDPQSNEYLEVMLQGPILTQEQKLWYVMTVQDTKFQT